MGKTQRPTLPEQSRQISSQGVHTTPDLSVDITTGAAIRLSATSELRSYIAIKDDHPCQTITTPLSPPPTY
jgi:hypothetical protein